MSILKKLASALKRPVAPELSDRFVPWIFATAGVPFAVFGGGLGAVMGMMIPVPFDYANLPGYESGMGFGSVVGMGLATSLLITLWVRDRIFRKRLYAVLSCAWLIALALGHILPQVGGTNPLMIWLFPIAILTLVSRRVQGMSREPFVRCIAYGAVATAAICTLLLFVSLGMQSQTHIPSAPERGRFTIGQVERTETTLSVTVTRPPAKATLLVWKTATTPSWLRRIGLHTRYDAEVNVLNRYDVPLFFGESAAFLPPEMLQEKLQNAPITNDQQREDVRLAMDALSLLYYSDTDIRDTFGSNLETMYDALMQAKIAIGRAP